MSPLAWQIPVYLLAFNAVLGLATAEYCFYSTRLARKVDEERDSKFPAWRRLDTPWMKRIYVYPMAATLAPLRIELFLLLVVFYFAIATVSHFVCYCGRADKRGCPNSSVQRLLGWIAYLWMLILGIIPQQRFIEADYSEWLGPDYLKTQKLPETIPTIVANHSSAFDIFILLSILKGKVSFVAAAKFERVPILGSAIKMLGGFFAPRFGTQEAKNALVDAIASH